MARQEQPTKAAERLGLLKAQQGLRIEDIAASTGISYRTITRWLTSKTEPSQRRAEVVGETFGFDWHELVDGEAS